MVRGVGAGGVQLKAYTNGAISGCEDKHGVRVPPADSKAQALVNLVCLDAIKWFGAGLLHAPAHAARKPLDVPPSPRPCAWQVRFHYTPIPNPDVDAGGKRGGGRKSDLASRLVHLVARRSRSEVTSAGAAAGRRSYVPRPRARKGTFIARCHSGHPHPGGI